MKAAVEFVAWLLMITSGLAAGWAVLEFLIWLAGVIDARFWLALGVCTGAAVGSILLFGVVQRLDTEYQDILRSRGSR